MRITHDNGQTDSRYTVAKEHAGHPTPVWVVRFNGAFVMACRREYMAWIKAGEHKQARGLGGGLRL